jgi:hypothetical protein
MWMMLTLTAWFLSFAGGTRIWRVMYIMVRISRWVNRVILVCLAFVTR